MTTPYARLEAEQLPTGTFGHAQPPQPTERPTRPAPTWTPEEQAQHRTDLLNALNSWDWDRNSRDHDRQHLRLITETDAA